MQHLLTYCIGILLFSLPMSMIPLRSGSPNGNTPVEQPARHESREADNADLNLYAAVISNEDDDAQPTVPPQSEDENILNAKNIRIINLGPAVNFPGLDYAPTVSADGKTLYYVSDRSGSKLNNEDDPSHDFWAVKKVNRYDTTFSKPYNIDTSTALGDLSVNTSLNEGVASISADQQTIVFTGCDRPDGIGSCDLYIAEIEGDKWGRPRNLGRNVNSELWDSQPSISPDKSRIYFASNRPGSVGGSEDMDIWYTDYDFEFEEWKPAVNAGPTINTKGKDWSPFISADNQTLFFSSNGHTPNLGGTDFYYCQIDDKGKWSKPINLGAPINTPEDEAFITLPASGDIIYFSSRREDLAHFQGNYDIFMAFVPSFFRTVTVTGVVIDECSNENIPAKVTITNPITKKVKHDSLNTSNYKEFSIILSNTDFGRPEDSINVVNLEITAENPTYGQVTEIVRVEKPAKTKNEQEAQQAIEIPPVTLKLGKKPKIGAEMDFADYIKENSDNPALANFKGLVMQEIKTISLYPLLNYVFFGEGEGTIPDRYILFKNTAQTESFTDEGIPGGTLEKYYNVLNIYGYRLRQYPDATLELVGCNDQGSSLEKRPGLSKERVENVFNYLKSIWGIDESRMKITIRDLPKTPSNVRDSLGIRENRRVELLCDTWEVVKPILDTDPTLFPSPETMDFTLDNGIDNSIVASRRVEVTREGKPWKTLREIGLTEGTYTWNWQSETGEYPRNEEPYEARLIVTSKSGRECISDPVYIKVKQVEQTEWTRGRNQAKTLERYSLILFPFDSYDAGPLNERILKEYVFPRVYPSTDIEVVGHTDVVGLYDHNKRLSENRAKTVQTGINRTAGGKYATLISRGVGEDDALYTNDLPEGRFYNRTVQVIIQTPLEDLNLK